MSNRVLIVVLIAFFMLLIVNARAAGVAPVPVMKAEATVEGDMVRLGDLVENAGAAATIPVFHAPALGASGTIQAHRLLAAAREHGLAVLDTRGLNETTVFRAARTVSVAELERAVADAAAQGLGVADAADIAVRLDRDVRALQIEPGLAGEVRVARFAYDPTSRRFEGVVEAPGSLVLRRHPVRIAGTLTETAEVLVLARELARGETLRETDVLVERRPRAGLAADALAAPAAALGQAARRPLRAGQTLRPADLMKPDLVARHDMVTILFETPGITLTARGKALGAGAEGETVAVLNAHSNRTLHAVVKGPGLVAVARNAATAAPASAVR